MLFLRTELGFYSGGALAAREDTRVDGLARARDGVKVHLVADDFSGHERQVGIESLRRKARPSVDVARPQLASGPDDKVRDPLLRLNALVEVVVPGEHDAHVVLQEERLEHFAQAEVRAVPVA